MENTPKIKETPKIIPNIGALCFVAISVLLQLTIPHHPIETPYKSHISDTSRYSKNQSYFKILESSQFNYPDTLIYRVTARMDSIDKKDKSFYDDIYIDLKQVDTNITVLAQAKVRHFAANENVTISQKLDSNDIATLDYFKTETERRVNKHTGSMVRTVKDTIYTDKFRNWESVRSMLSFLLFLIIGIAYCMSMIPKWQAAYLRCSIYFFYALLLIAVLVSRSIFFEPEMPEEPKEYINTNINWYG